MGVRRNDGRTRQTDGSEANRQMGVKQRVGQTNEYATDEYGSNGCGLVQWI